MEPTIQAAAEQASETVTLESSAVKAEAAAEATLIAAESAVSLANVQAAVVVAEAAETIREAEQTIEVLEGSLEWLGNRVAQLDQSNQTEHSEIWAELRRMGEAIALLTVPLMDSLSATPPISETGTEAIAVVQTAEPGNLQNVDAADQRAAEAPVTEARKKKRRFL